MSASYQLKILTDFASAHTLRDYPGACSRMHGHNWKVVVTVEGKTLNETGLLIDFKKLKKILKRFTHPELIALLEVDASTKTETQKQINSFKKARDKIFTFLLYPNVPPDNNGSERAIRNLKVKLKVSQQFKSSQGAKDYGILRSVIDTARKRDMNEFEVIRDIVGGGSIF